MVCEKESSKIYETNGILTEFAILLIILTEHVLCCYITEWNVSVCPQTLERFWMIILVNIGFYNNVTLSCYYTMSVYYNHIIFTSAQSS